MKIVLLLVVLFAFIAAGFASPAELPKLPKGNQNKGKDKGKDKGKSPPPVMTLKQKVDEQWAAMKTHVLEGDKHGNEDAGRHTLSSWQAKNKDEGWCHKQTHICVFRMTSPTPKTVWDDRSGKFTKADIESMCKKVIADAYGRTGKKPNRDQAYIVKTKNGHHICTQFQVAGHGSCYPTALNDLSDMSEGADCTGMSHGRIDKQVPEKSREVISKKK
ncbi:hypothetical protein HGRIS_010641 [Hohenbuehelia grisea]|uniref:Uncharacterized protein n=1 Tax=Hohenbuehelia grisea TaxID=104357 RepID=A0ABR3IXJ7_9AGAR